MRRLVEERVDLHGRDIFVGTQKVEIDGLIHQKIVDDYGYMVGELYVVERQGIHDYAVRDGSKFFIISDQKQVR